MTEQKYTITPKIVRFNWLVFQADREGVLR
jgi:hypothetical protein